MEVIDTCGLSCPQPVLLVLQHIKEHQPHALAVLVDNEASQENVSRAAENRGYSVQTGEEKPGVVRLVLNRK